MHVRKLPIKANFSPDCIIATDETAVWFDMVENVTVDTIGTKDVPLKSTGNEKVKVSECLTAKADGTKLKPFIVFQGAKPEATTLNEEFKNRCVVVSSSNGWMNEELVLKFLRQVLGMFSCKKTFIRLGHLRGQHDRGCYEIVKTDENRSCFDSWRMHQVCSSTRCGLEQIFQRSPNGIL